MAKNYSLLTKTHWVETQKGRDEQLKKKIGKRPRGTPHRRGNSQE